MNSKVIIIILVVIVLLLLCCGITIFGLTALSQKAVNNIKSDISQTSTGFNSSMYEETTSTKTSNKCLETAKKANLNEELIANNEFESSTSWYNQVWFKENSNTSDKNTFSNGTYQVTALEPTLTSTRSGIQQDLNVDVSDADSIILKARVKVNQTTQAGSGSQGREAPLAIAITYYDTDCLLHSTLGEKPGDTNRVYWMGFNYLNGTGGYSNSGYTKVNMGEWYDFEVDLKSISPSVIKNVAIEGSGWYIRNGEIDSISLIAN